MSLIISIWSGDRTRKHVCLLKENESIVAKVRAKFGVEAEEVLLVLERDGTIVEPDFELLSHLSQLKETVMVLAPGEMWTSAVVQVGSSQQDDADVAQSRSPSVASCVPLASTPTGSQRNGLGPFTDVAVFRQFIVEHPSGRTAARDLEAGTITSSTRQLIVRLATHKLVSMFGNYPDKTFLIRSSSVLGDLLGMPATVFYDPKSYDGFLPRCLQNFRRKLSESDRKFSWNRKRKPTGPLLLPAVSSPSTSAAVAEIGGSDVSSHLCVRKIDDCSLCLGKDFDSELVRFRLLSAQRFEELKSAAQSTFCRRRKWIIVEKPLLTAVLRDYPKFQSTPQLLDLEFATLLPEATDFMVEFPSVMDHLWKHAEHCTVPAVRQTLLEAASVDLEWKAWYALKVLCLLLRPSTRKRISGAEALPSICRIVPIGSSLETEVGQLSTYFPVLIIQGEIGGIVASVKVSAETKLVEAGSTIVEGIDRLFKMFWILNMSYPENCDSVFRFLEYKAYNIKEKKIPPTVLELCSYLSKYIQ